MLSTRLLVFLDVNFYVAFVLNPCLAGFFEVPMLKVVVPTVTTKTRLPTAAGIKA